VVQGRPRSRQRPGSAAAGRCYCLHQAGRLQPRRDTDSRRQWNRLASDRTYAGYGHDGEGVGVRSCNDVRYGVFARDVTPVSSGVALRCSCGSRGRTEKRHASPRRPRMMHVECGTDCCQRRDRSCERRTNAACHRRARTTHAVRRPFLLCARLHGRKSQALRDHPNAPAGCRSRHIAAPASATSIAA